MITLVKNIGSLIGIRAFNQLLRKEALADLTCIHQAYLILHDDRIADFGHMADLTENHSAYQDIIDAKGQFVWPCWSDSHTHIVFAGSRENEFVDKIKGMTYADIAARGGGILNSAERLSQASEESLFESAMIRFKELIKLGTGSIEIKSGYGLSVDAELKMLRVIQRIKAASEIPVKSTFLGAHSFPIKFKENHEGYISEIIDKMLPVIGEEGLADYIDVFCEKGFFSVQDMERICEAGMKYGLKPKLHINQLNSIGGIASAVEMGAVSVDHLETMTAEDVDILASSKTIGTLLPTAAFFLRMPFQPARQLIDAGVAVALASDYNPGSSPSGNMNFVVSLSCIQMKMLPEEAINAATLNAAYAMECEKDLGSITKGKLANLIFTKPLPSIAYLPYSFGSNLIERVMINGKFIV
jgi:imidazolonepropionase